MLTRYIKKYYPPNETSYIGPILLKKYLLKIDVKFSNKLFFS